MMKKISYFLLLAGFCILYAEKLEVTADKFLAEDAVKEVRFVGNAKVLQGDTRVTADEVIVYFNEDNSTEKYKALGKVRFHIKKSEANYQGRCHEMLYFPKKKTYILKGSVNVQDLRNHRNIAASRVEIHSKTGAFTIEGSKKNAASLTFEMQ